MRTNILLMAAISLITLSSAATQTPVYDYYGNNGTIGGTGEWNLYNSGIGPYPGSGVMEYLYGAGDFTRLNDADVITWAGSGAASAVVKYSGDNQALYTASLSGAYNSASPILTMNVESGTPSRPASGASFSPATQPFLFLDVSTPGVTATTYAYSNPALTTSGDGVNGVDRMVAFAVTGYLATPGNASSWTAFSDGSTHYVLAFENGEDYDFNDLVVEVSGVSPADLSVPDGGSTLWLMAAALVVLAALRRNLPLPACCLLHPRQGRPFPSP
jgi:hypothetical protein